MSSPMRALAFLALGGTLLAPIGASAQGGMGFPADRGFQPGYGQPLNQRYAGPDMDRFGREQFDRGYRMGVEEMRMRGGYGAAHMDRFGREQFDRGYLMGRQEALVGPSRLATGMARGQFEHPDIAILLVERDRQRQRMEQLRQAIQEARTALQQNEQQRAQQALSRADEVVQQSLQTAQTWEQVQQLLQRAEQALDQNNTAQAQQAMRSARQALETLAARGGAPAMTEPGQAARAGTGTAGREAETGATTGATTGTQAPAGGPAAGATPTTGQQAQ